MMSHETDFSVCIFLRDFRLLSFLRLGSFRRSFHVRRIHRNGVLFLEQRTTSSVFHRYFVSSFYFLCSFVSIFSVFPQRPMKIGANYSVRSVGFARNDVKGPELAAGKATRKKFQSLETHLTSKNDLVDRILTLTIRRKFVSPRQKQTRQLPSLINLPSSSS